MNLNPEDRTNWQGFLDLLQPPMGYRLSGALGTTFGLSTDALVAALLAMCDADGEELASNPVAAIMAITRMSSKVRVLVHPGTINAPTSDVGSNRFVALLDRLVVEVHPPRGLFHPKVWALRFEHIGPVRPGKPAEVGRVVIGSRNLTRSTSFELGVVFDGTQVSEGAVPSEFGSDVARALREWLMASGARYPESVWRLPTFIGGLTFDVPHEASQELRLRYQGGKQKPLADLLPDRLTRAVVVSPFLQPDFVTNLLKRTDAIQIVSIPESLDALSDEIIASLDARAALQGSPVLYQVTNHGNPDDSYIDGIHAKLLLAESPRHTATFVGSANATQPAWGLVAASNVEAMVEMRPGISIDRFVSGFIRESSELPHPWISKYDRSAKAEPDSEKEAERKLLVALRDLASIELALRFDRTLRRLTLSLASRRSTLPVRFSTGVLKFSLTPLLLVGTPGAWRALSDLEVGDCHFEQVPVESVSAFVALRVESTTPPLERQRIALAKLEAVESLLDERDQLVRADILATADPAMVLNALVRGLAHVRSDGVGEFKRAATSPGIRELFMGTTLERVLQAVALDPGLLIEMRQLLGPIHGDPLLKLCDAMEAAMGSLRTEATS